MSQFAVQMGETHLGTLIESMRPTLNSGTYVYCHVPNPDPELHRLAVMVFREKEGDTLILEQAMADQLGLGYTFVAGWITLRVHSALEAVGLTAAFASALARAGISCNVVAGYFHDHVFVPIDEAQQALEVLKKLSHGGD